MADKAIVTIYSRPGCHLCDEAIQALYESGCTERCALHEVNIEDDPELEAKYGHDIPVILIDGVEAFRHHVSAKDFRERLKRRD